MRAKAVEGIAMMRLLRRPTFILSTVRSGSTLLRCLMNSHSRVCAPSELHLGSIQVRVEGEHGQLAMDVHDLPIRELEYMLWDQVLARLLQRSRKDYLIEKTPANVKIVPRLVECWPDAKFIVLRRNPAAIVESIVANGHTRPRALTVVTEAVIRLDEVALHLSAHEITYEGLLQDPRNVLAETCEFVGVVFEPSMMAYGDFDHGTFEYGIGDWGKQIRSGRVQSARRVLEPAEPELLDLCQRWGYYTDTSTVAPA